MSGALSEFVDLMADEITIRRAVGAPDFRGKRTYGDPFVVKAYVAGRVRQVTDPGGTVRTSTVTAVLGEYLQVTTSDEFTLPDRFVPRVKPAISVEESVDENGPHHETVYF